MLESPRVLMISGLRKQLRPLIALAPATALLLLAGCYPPPPQYPFTPQLTERRSTLNQNLLELLPPEQRQLPAAVEEARWLADTSYKAAAAIARINNSNFPGWAGNALINAYIQDRGLCWHYQHDMYRELRRRPLTYFRIGCCVRDFSELTEHNCVYIAAANGQALQFVATIGFSNIFAVIEPENYSIIVDFKVLASNAAVGEIGRAHV